MEEGFYNTSDKSMYVRISLPLAGFLTGYTALMSIPICLVGLFSELEILITGLVHAVIAVILFASFKGLLYRRRWARLLLVGLSGLVTAAISIGVGLSLRSGTNEPVGMIWFMIIALSFGCLAFCLSTKTAGVWFNQ